MSCTCNARDCGPGSGHESGCGTGNRMCLSCEFHDHSECYEYDALSACCCGHLIDDHHSDDCEECLSDDG